MCVALVACLKQCPGETSFWANLYLIGQSTKMQENTSTECKSVLDSCSRKRNRNHDDDEWFGPKTESGDCIHSNTGDWFVM